jgi:hypothetical protein
VPGLLAFHVPNQGKRDAAQNAILKAMGVRAGVSDVILVHRGRIYALELKAAGGRLSEAQRKFKGDFLEAGGITGTAEGLSDALATLEDWGLLLRGTTLRDAGLTHAPRSA